MGSGQRGQHMDQAPGAGLPHGREGGGAPCWPVGLLRQVHWAGPAEKPRGLGRGSPGGFWGSPPPYVGQPCLHPLHRAGRGGLGGAGRRGRELEVTSPSTKCLHLSILFGEQCHLTYRGEGLVKENGTFPCSLLPSFASLSRQLFTLPHPCHWQGRRFALTNGVSVETWPDEGQL